MRLTADRLERLQGSLQRALSQEWPQLNRMQRQLARLEPTPIATRPINSLRLPIVATVATDGGQSRLQLEPIRVQVLRVADSNGEVYFEGFIPLSLEPRELFRFCFQAEPRLQKFLDWLGVDWNALLPTNDFQRSHLLEMMRELMEWAALLKLASQRPPKLLVRDGLLRSVLLPDAVFQRLRDRFAAFTGKHGHLLVGVAKRSRVINYLAVALGLSETFAGGTPGYLAVPAELEREAAPTQYRWIGSRAMGQLHIARLDRGEAVPLLPVDVAAWQTDRVAEAMALLHESSRASFPLRGYPQALVQAHQHTHLGGLEVEMFEQMLLSLLVDRQPQVAAEARRQRLLGRQLALLDQGEEEAS